ncbi:conserved hypothetical protein [delta proteobacterium NaphS2]|nr:conserved hypothetical protein [delta proteobacterium NaphS2]
MPKKTMFKRTQVQGKKYDLPAEEVEIEKLIRKGLSLSERISALNSQLDQIKSRLTSLARDRRDGTTTKLKGISGTASVTFRETLICDDRILEIKQDLGSLFDRFFQKKEGWKATKNLRQFLEGEHAFGLKDPEEIKALIGSHVTQKETKPNVKLVPSEF